MKFFLLLFTALFLTACAPDPYHRADPVRLAEENRIGEIRKDLRNSRFLLSRFRYEEARPILFRAVSAAELTGWPPLLMEALHTRGLYHLEKNQQEQALSSFQEALPLARRARLVRNEAEILNNIAHIHLLRDEPDQALPLLLTAEKKTKEPAVRLPVRNNMAWAWFQKNEPSKALQILERNVKEANKKGLYTAEISGLLLTAEILSGKNPLRGLVQARKAFDAAEFWDDDRGRIKSLQRLLLLYRQADNIIQEEIVFRALSALSSRLGLPSPE